MATTKAKRKAAPADGAETTGNLQAAWPFPRVKPADVDDVTPKGELPADAAPVPVAERIHVDQVDLYADPTKNTVEQIAIEQLVESPFNPRTTFNYAALEELAESMRSVGVMQAILVRPVTMPGGFVITKGGEPQQAYEIIFGHRRYRAAKLAGLITMPCIVRELTDVQAAQLQAIENVQREDLDPVEEARGYAHYLKVHGVTKDQLAAEVGLSRTHVYSRLKLASAAAAVLDALHAGEIYEENALRIARLPSEKLQLKALETLRKDYRYDPDDGGKKSVRRIQEFLRERFTLQLREAIFEPADAKLLELAGACTTCPKRSGNAPEFADLARDTEKEYGGKHLLAGPDLCTDPDCFEAKKKAHLANKAAELTAKGKTVITGGKARSAISADGIVKGAYIELKAVKAELAKKGKKAGVDVAIVTIQNPRDGKTKEAIAIADLEAAGVRKKSKAGAKGAGERDSWEEQRKRQEAERREQQVIAAAETKVNEAILSATREAAAGRQLTTLAMQHIALVAFRGVDWPAKRVIAQLHGAKNEGAMVKAIGSMPPEKLTTLLLDCALTHHVVASGYRDEKPAALLAIAKELGVDVAQIRKDAGAKAADTKTQDLPLESEQTEEEEAEEA